VSLARLIAIATVVVAAGSVLALLLDHRDQGLTSTETVAVTKTVTATKTVTQTAASGAATSTQPELPAATEAGFKLHWNGRLRLNQTGHGLDGDDDPSPPRPDSSSSVSVDYLGNIDFSDVTVAEWTRSDAPTPSECAAQVKTQGLSSDEADSIPPRKGLRLCLTLATADRSPRIGYMRVLPGFTNVAVNVEGVLWDKP
jgi:hypothetical protein